MKKILIIHTGGMGDFLMFTPAYRELLKLYPNSEIDFYLTNKNVREILLYYPNIKNIYTTSLKKKEIFNQLLILRKNIYDCSFFTTGGKLWKTNLFLAAIKSKLKIGEYKFFKSLIFNNNIKRREDTHFVENNLRIVHSIGTFPLKSSYSPWFPLDMKKTHNEKFIIGIHPGSQAAYKNRRWNKYEALIEKLNKIFKENIRIKVFIGPEEKELKKMFSEKILFVENKDIY